MDRLDVLFNNATITAMGAVEEVPIDDGIRVMPLISRPHYY